MFFLPLHFVIDTLVTLCQIISSSIYNYFHTSSYSIHFFVVPKLAHVDAPKIVRGLYDQEISLGGTVVWLVEVTGKSCLLCKS